MIRLSYNIIGISKMSSANNDLRGLLKSLSTFENTTKRGETVVISAIPAARYQNSKVSIHRAISS